MAKKKATKKKATKKKSTSKKKTTTKKPGLWANIHKKQARIKEGSGETMRKPGSKGAPKKKAITKSQK